MPDIPQGAKKPADRLKAEVENETADSTAYEFKGQTFLVLPFMDWDKSAMSAINNLDFNGWALGAMSQAEAVRFRTVRATFRETVEFIKTVTETAGVDVGELFASQPS